MSLMMLRHLPLYCTLLLVCAPAFGAQDDEVETLAADVAAQLEVVLSSGGGDAEGVLASDCIAVHADIDLLLDVLEGIIDDDQTPRPRLRAAQWTLADVLHRYGDMKWADEILDELVESGLSARRSCRTRRARPRTQSNATTRSLSSLQPRRSKTLYSCALQ